MHTRPRRALNRTFPTRVSSVFRSVENYLSARISDPDPIEPFDLRSERYTGQTEVGGVKAKGQDTRGHLEQRFYRGLCNQAILCANPYRRHYDLALAKISPVPPTQSLSWSYARSILSSFDRSLMQVDEKSYRAINFRYFYEA